MIILREKTYAIIPDLFKYGKNSGFKRGWKKNIGEARRKLAGRINKSITKDVDKNKKSVIKFAVTQERRNSKLMKEALKEAKSSGVRTVSSQTVFGTEASGMNWKSKDLDKLLNPDNAETRNCKKLKNAVEKSGDIISIGRKSGQGELLHELGHVKTRNRKGLIGKIARIADSPESRITMNSSLITNQVERMPDFMIPVGMTRKDFILANGAKYDTAAGLGEAIKRWAIGKAILADEKLATKSAIRDLKKLGATKEEIRAAKEGLQAGYDTYKPATKVSWKSALENKVQIPSRRRS